MSNIKCNIAFNANDSLLVTLSSKGQEVYREHQTQFPPKYRLRVPELNEKVRMQFWEVAHIFGAHMYLGAEHVFAEIALVAPLKQVAKALSATTHDTSLDSLSVGLARRPA